MFKILIACTANICRSPLGEAILNKMIERENLSDQIEVGSFGIWGSDGFPTSETSQKVAAENGLDVSKHLSRSISPTLIKSADLILCMTSSHKNDLLHVFPHMESKIFTLKEYGRNTILANDSIDDPIGMNLNFYRRIYREIENELTRIFPLIKKKKSVA